MHCDGILPAALVRALMQYGHACHATATGQHSRAPGQAGHSRRDDPQLAPHDRFRSHHMMRVLGSDVKSRHVALRLIAVDESLFQQ